MNLIKLDFRHLFGVEGQDKVCYYLVVQIISSTSEIGTMSDSVSRRQEETLEKGNIHGKFQALVSQHLGGLYAAA